MPDRLCRSRDLSTGERGRKREREILCSLLSLRSLCERLREGALSCAERPLLRVVRGAGVLDRSVARGLGGERLSRSRCERLRDVALACVEQSLLRVVRGAGVLDLSLASGTAGGGGGRGGRRANTDVMMAVTWSGVKPPWVSFVVLMVCGTSVVCRSSVTSCLQAAVCAAPLLLARADDVGLGALFPCKGGGRPASAALLGPERLRVLSSLASVSEPACASWPRDESAATSVSDPSSDISYWMMASLSVLSSALMGVKLTGVNFCHLLAGRESVVGADGLVVFALVGPLVLRLGGVASFFCFACTDSSLILAASERGLRVRRVGRASPGLTVPAVLPFFPRALCRSRERCSCPSVQASSSS